MKRHLRDAALLVAVGLAGGALALAVGTRDHSHTVVTTVERQVAPLALNAAQTAASRPLSAGAIYRKEAPGVVVITATTVTNGQNPFDPFGGPNEQRSQSLGSGFVIDKQGHILTNAHVVLNADKVQVGFSNGQTYPAKVLGLDKSTDVAVLKVDVPAEALTPLPLGTSKEVAVGDPVVAIGNPLGEERTITSGIISAKFREIDSLVPGIKIFGALQTDAAINHGNSGGPLIDAAGNVVGITSQILSDSNSPTAGNIGIGFAIPIDTARRVADQIIRTGKAEHTFLGIEGSEVTPPIAKALHLSVDHGVLIGRVTPNSPAAKAGLHGGRSSTTIQGVTIPLGGDVIVSIDGHNIETFSDLAERIAAMKAGDRVTLEILRDGSTRTVTVTLANRSG
jgi:S1-C subfamily serine protease